jgi:hypothetical protein
MWLSVELAGRFAGGRLLTIDAAVADHWAEFAGDAQRPSFCGSSYQHVQSLGEAQLTDERPPIYFFNRLDVG